MLGILVDHLDNIITGFGFSYTFCDAEVALNDKFLSLGGIKEKGMSAFIPQSAKAEQIKAMTKCKWIPNDNYWKGVSLGLGDLRSRTRRWFQVFCRPSAL